jgi:hypothetical protein
MMDDIGVRIGTPEDIDGMMAVALAACSENGFVDPNPQKLLAEIWPALNRVQGIVGIIGAPGERIEGAVLLRVGAMWYSDREVLEERAIFIHPDYRAARGGRAKRLCQFSKQAADGLGLPLIIGVLSNHRTQGKVRMYRRIFGEPSGAFFLYGARTGEAAGVTEH